MYKTHRTEGSVVQNTHTGGAKGMEEGHANSGGLGAISRGQRELERELRAAEYGTEPKVPKHTARADAIRLAARPS